MGFSQILETVYFRENVKQVSNEKTGVILKVLNLYGIYLREFGWTSGPDINTAVVLVKLF